MPINISKDILQQKLEETGALFENAKTEEEKNTLREQAYWLTQALENENPQEVLTRAFSFWEKSNGKTGLKPFEISVEKEAISKIPPSPPFPKWGSPPPGFTLWGTLDRAFQSGEKLDDKTVSVLFNRLPPITQTHFIDTAESYIKTTIGEERRSKTGSDQSSSKLTKRALLAGDTITIEPLLRNESVLLDLVEKTKQIAAIKEELVQRSGRKIADWLRYHQTEPRTEQRLEEVLYGPEALKMLTKKRTDEEETFFKKALNENLTQYEEEIILAALPPYERNIRDRLRMSTAEYLRIRHVLVEKLLDAVPADPKQLALVTQSAVRQELLEVPEAEFQKRVRTAHIIHDYAFGKELRYVTIRQFFRALVEG